MIRAGVESTAELCNFPFIFLVYNLCTTKFNTHKFYVLPTLYLCVLCGSQNKQQLFPYTALTDWFV
jgi:hypothetical protein